MSQFPSQFNLYDVFNMMVFPIGACIIAIAIDYEADGKPDLLNNLKARISEVFTITPENSEKSISTNSADKPAAKDFAGATLLAAAIGMLAFVAAFVLGSVAGAIADIIRFSITNVNLRTICDSTDLKPSTDKIEARLVTAQLLQKPVSNEALRRYGNRLWAAVASISEEWRFVQIDRFNALAIMMFNLSVLFSVGFFFATTFYCDFNLTTTWVRLSTAIIGVGLVYWSRVWLTKGMHRAAALVTGLILMTIASLPWSHSSPPLQNPLSICCIAFGFAAAVCIARWHFFSRVHVEKTFRTYLLQTAEKKDDDPPSHLLTVYIDGSPMPILGGAVKKLPSGPRNQGGKKNKR